ncbi:peptide deformylase [uncultured Devosia sp.]|uniref:peptide deformylase n=1 Tax=uncultured Devosia sp. TaxID=211434 RepID=UPI002602C3AE|nr:peptide deformylase [uncultured Devosia sp.]
MTFIHYPDDRFNIPAVMRDLDDRLLAIGSELLAAATEAQAYGLAAVHIGHVEPVAVVSLSDPGTRDYRLLFNPQIEELNGDVVSGKEGSVSMPGIEVEVNRHSVARISFTDASGVAQDLQLSGFPARVAQHEIDQVHGIFFLSRVSRLKRETAIKRYTKLGRRMG